MGAGVFGRKNDCGQELIRQIVPKYFFYNVKLKKKKNLNFQNFKMQLATNKRSNFLL